jgi:hypothetical protein|tara:strand:+ start:557 stop:772 length:216 start_codon:yes stop_codon:yes gene_type:complete
MTRQNKYLYLYVVQGNYGGYWEDLSESDTHKEARYNLTEYMISSGPSPHRIIQRREPNPAYFSKQMAAPGF